MTIERLSNERWGFSSNCFVCEPSNAVGLRQRFFHDTVADLVVADLELGSSHSGAPSYVHGGVQLALLDEAMAWAAIAVAERFAVTASFSSTFHHPIKIDRRYRLEAAIDAVTATDTVGVGADHGRPRPGAHFGRGHAGRAVGRAGRRRRRNPRCVDRRIHPAVTRRSIALAARRVVGYLAGTFPSASVASRLASGGAVDLRTSGSGNPGALNAAQQLGSAWGVGVLLTDAAKGSSVRCAGRRLAGDAGAYMAATAAIAGHIAPMWSGFRGGKGVATSAGACLAVFPAYFPIDAAVAAAGAAGTRNPETAVRISSLVWTAAAVVWWRRGWPNGWGPHPTFGLPLFAATSSAMILAKFAHVRRGRRR